MDADTCKPDTNTAASSIKVRRSCQDDLPRIMAISNWAIEHTTANFGTEPETLDHWAERWKDTRKQYPWFVAERDGQVVGFAMAAPFKSR